MNERIRRLRGALGFTFDTVDDVTKLVERTHRRVRTRTLGWARLSTFGSPAAGELVAYIAAVDEAASGLRYGSVRAVNHLVRGVVDTSFRLAAAAAEEPGEAEARFLKGGAPFLEHAQSALNGVYGDRLATRSNELDLGMSVRIAGRPVDLRKERLPVGEHVVFFLHGLGMNEACWGVDLRSDVLPPHCFGARAEAELGLSPLYVRYNSGRPIWQNGEALSRLLAQFLATHPAVSSLTLVGHSMGGLVARSADLHAMAAGSDAPPPWHTKLRAVVCIGSPNHGAPLAKAAHALSRLLLGIPTAGTEVVGEVLAARSAGIADLRSGALLEGRGPQTAAQPVANPTADGVKRYFIASSAWSAKQGDPVGAARMGANWVGDWIVPVESASGHAPGATRRDGEETVAAFDDGIVVEGVDHIRLTTDPRVFTALAQLLTASPPG